MPWKRSEPTTGGLSSKKIIREGNLSWRTCKLDWTKSTFVAKYHNASADKSIYRALRQSFVDIKDDTVLCVHRFKDCKCAYVTVFPDHTMSPHEWDKCPLHKHKLSWMNHESRLGFYWEQRQSLTCSHMIVEYPADMPKAEAEGDASTGTVQDPASSSTDQQSWAAAQIPGADSTTELE